MNVISTWQQHMDGGTMSASKGKTIGVALNGQHQAEDDKEIDGLIDVHQAANFLSLVPGTVYHLVSQGRLPCVRLSARCLRFRKSELDKFIRQRSVPAK
jgi:excisionase family DNA binding protein